MNDDVVVYKFRSLDNEFHRNVLLQNELYMPNITELNDPFEVFDSLDISYLRKDIGGIRFLINYGKSICSEPKHADKIKPLFGNVDNMMNSITMVEEFCFENYFPKNKVCNFIEFIEHKEKMSCVIDKLFKIYSDIYYSMETFVRRSLFGIISFSFAIDNVLMWSHYANNHTGFAVGFDVEKLLFKENDNSPLFHFFNNVIYSNDVLQHKPLPIPFFENFENETEFFLKKMNEKMSIDLFRKSKDWEYEKEFRCVNFYTGDSNRIFTVDNSCIKEVVFGLKCCDDNNGYRNLLIDYCKKHCIPMFIMRQIHRKYELEKVPFNI